MDDDLQVVELQCQRVILRHVGSAGHRSAATASMLGVLEETARSFTPTG